MAKRILVVEDEPDICRIMKTLLEKEGYEVIVVHDGEAGLDHVQSETEHFDLVITDLALPKASGLQVIKAVKQKGACPVVAMSTHWQFSPLMDEAEKLGCDAVLGKPFHSTQLIAIVNGQIGGS